MHFLAGQLLKQSLSMNRNAILGIFTTLSSTGGVSGASVSPKIFLAPISIKLGGHVPRKQHFTNSTLFSSQGQIRGLGEGSTGLEAPWKTKALQCQEFLFSPCVPTVEWPS